MRILFVLLCLLFATSASAVIDPDTNSMGFYFDVNADVYEYSTASYVVVPVHVILTRPDFDIIYGYEFSYEIIGNAMVSSRSFYGPYLNDPDIVAGWEISPGNFRVTGMAYPTSPATPLCTLHIFVMDANPSGFELKGAQPNSVPGSVTPTVLLAGDVNVPIGVSAGLVDGDTQVCAYINGSGVVASDKASWDSVKSLYR